MMLMAVCGCTTPTQELPTSRPPPRSRRKSSSITAARLSSADPEIAKKLEELNQLRRDSKTRTANAPLQKKYDDLENNLNKCKDDLRELQRKSVTASPTHLRSRFDKLSEDLATCKKELEALHNEAKSAGSESMQKKYEALQFVLLRYRKDIEEELQKCWTQLKLLHIAGSNQGDDDDQESDVPCEECEECKSEAESEAEKLRIVPLALERNPRRPRCALLWKPPLPDPRDKKHYDERKLMERLTCRKHRLGYRDKPPKYYQKCEMKNADGEE